ncbi:MAG: hypothetical protein ACRC7R_00040 [Sarcina sp.]
MIKEFFIEILISTLVIFMILVNYKKIKFTKKYGVCFFITGIILLFINILAKYTFEYGAIITTIISAVIMPIELTLIVYLGIYLNKIKENRRVRNK